MMSRAFTKVAHTPEIALSLSFVAVLVAYLAAASAFA
jgi:hypothetical protein